MRNLPLLLALLLSACTYVGDPAQNESQIVTPGNFRAGSGVIQQIHVSGTRLQKLFGKKK